MKHKTIITQILLSLVLIGCSEILLIGAYDENVDESLQTISKEVSTLIVKIKQNVIDNKDWSCAAFRDDYTKINAEINALNIRVKGLEKYKIIESQIALLSNSMLVLQKDHCSGFAKPGQPIENIIKSIELDQSGVENSLIAMIKLQNGLKREKVSAKK